MNCIFCKIVNKEINSYILYEDEMVLCFLDIMPASMGHCLIIPKKHYSCFSKTDDNFISHISIVKKKIVKLLDDTLKPLGYNYLSNENKIAGQEVMHYHEHIIPKYIDSGFKYDKNNKLDITNESLFDLYKKIMSN